MIDNPLPNQIMEQKQRDFEDDLFKDHCYEQAKEICEQNDVFTDLIEHFQKWYHSHYSDKPQEMPNVISAEDVDLINTWWDEEGYLYDDYISPYEDFDPTPYHGFQDDETCISAEERSRAAFEQKLRDKG